VDTAGDPVATRSITLLKATKDIALDVVQVQRFLPDISATRVQDGLDKGLKEARRFADKFEQDFAVAANVAEALHQPEIIGILPELKLAFRPC
jgi:methyl-accepting chemotaxis protein